MAARGHDQLQHIRILYIHGMEAGPHDVKFKALNVDTSPFRNNVYAPNQQVSILRLQCNSILWNLMKQPIVICSALTSMFAFGALHIYKADRDNDIAGYLKYCALLSCVLSWVYWRKRLLSRAITQSMQSCIQLECGAIQHYKPDVIIGASWGGFIAMKLIQSGHWNGRTILLAPGYVACMKRLNYGITCSAKLSELMTLSKGSLKHKILLVHSDTDRIVNVEDSKLLHSLNEHCMHLQIIANDNHVLEASATSGKLTSIIKQYALSSM